MLVPHERVRRRCAQELLHARRRCGRDEGRFGCGASGEVCLGVEYVFGSVSTMCPYLYGLLRTQYEACTVASIPSMICEISSLGKRRNAREMSVATIVAHVATESRRVPWLLPTFPVATAFGNFHNIISNMHTYFLAVLGRPGRRARTKGLRRRCTA